MTADGKALGDFSDGAWFLFSGPLRSPRAQNDGTELRCIIPEG
jgi:hypothetical protein